MNYTVKGGDNLYSIGKQLGFTLDEMLQANTQLPNPDWLQVGQVINLPPNGAKPMPHIAYNGIFTSPVSKNSNNLVPQGWRIAEDFDEVYPAGFGELSGKQHTGVDITQRGCYGKPIYAIYHAVVAYAGNPPNDWGWGNLIILQLSHIDGLGDGVYVRYAHMSKIDCEIGQVVKRGQVIGHIGDGEDHAYMPHLHIDCRTKKYDNPSLRSYGTDKWVRDNYMSPHDLFSIQGV